MFIAKIMKDLIISVLLENKTHKTIENQEQTSKYKQQTSIKCQLVRKMLIYKKVNQFDINIFIRNTESKSV